MDDTQKQTLAQSIPQNRQARLSGKKYPGPVNATPPKTLEPTTVNDISTPPQVQKGNKVSPKNDQPQSPEIAKKTRQSNTNLEKERIENDFKEDFQKEIMRQELETKEDEIARLVFNQTNNKINWNNSPNSLKVILAQ